MRTHEFALRAGSAAPIRHPDAPIRHPDEGQDPRVLTPPEAGRRTAWSSSDAFSPTDGRGPSYRRASLSRARSSALLRTASNHSRLGPPRDQAVPLFPWNVWNVGTVPVFRLVSSRPRPGSPEPPFVTNPFGTVPAVPAGAASGRLLRCFASVRRHYPSGYDRGDAFQDGRGRVLSSDTWRDGSPRGFAVRTSSQTVPEPPRRTTRPQFASLCGYVPGGDSSGLVARPLEQDGLVPVGPSGPAGTPEPSPRSVALRAPGSVIVGRLPAPGARGQRSGRPIAARSYRPASPHASLAYRRVCPPRRGPLGGKSCSRTIPPPAPWRPRLDAASGPLPGGGGVGREEHLSASGSPRATRRAELRARLSEPRR